MLGMFLSPLCIHAFVLLQFSVASCIVPGNETDQKALLHFKSKITDDPFGVLRSWNNSIHFCKWYGVVCGRRHQRVTMLVLPHKKLTGTISPYIGNLSFLRKLRLLDNNFHSRIPSQIGGLRRLQRLDLSNNSISGEIPSNISACSNLIKFRVGKNKLEGDIPKELALLTKLDFVSVSTNDLTGTIPSSLGNVSALRTLFMGRNNVVGTIPDTLGKLKNLKYFSVGNNQLTGTIPPSMFNLSRLKVFQVYYNKIQGSLPWDLGITLPNLQEFLFHTNQFTGSIPTTLSNASNLVTFEVSRNEFFGRVPSLEKLQKLVWFTASANHLGSGESGNLNFICSMANATNLGHFSISRNNFEGALQGCIGNLSTTLAYLSLRDNKLRGSIPSSVGHLVGLEVLRLAHNRFTGVIPSTIGKLSNLKELYLFENRLSGSMPSTLGNLTQLLSLGLSYNYLHGHIPLSLGSCQNLLNLELHNNKLNGTIPPQIMSISPLLFLILSNNYLTGALPEDIGNLRSLEILDVSRNMLDGKLPSNLGKCTSLEDLSMQGNYLQGNIPSPLSSLRGLLHIDLSQNSFSGGIPIFLESFSLEYLNLSYNNFEGAVPTRGIFKNASGTSVKGNKKLCGGIFQFHLESCEAKNKSKKRRLPFLGKLLIAICLGVLGVAIILSLLLYMTRKKRQEYSSSDLDSLPMRLSYQNLYNATNGFSSANLIGVGSFGFVYKGILDRANTFVAIKVLNLQHPMASRSFIAECTTLRNIRHRNLVKVFSACSSIDYQGNNFLALVYEFMVNGSLDEWLHSKQQNREEGNVKPRKLSLLQRVNIAIDVAHSLEYLHKGCAAPVAHCDLKPCNVLLDAELTAHVADFGLAKLLTKATADVSIGQPPSIGVRGTIGYVAPEYGMGSEVTTRGDVYSYGILLLEMFTGMRPTKDMFHQELNLHKFAKLALPEKVLEIMDPCLRGEIEIEEESSRIDNRYKSAVLECLISIFEIGINCSLEQPAQRVEISHAVSRLQVVKKKLSQNWIRKG